MIMEKTQWSYFQFRKKHGYQVYLRFRSEHFNSKFGHLLSELGFNELTEAEAKKIPLQKSQTRLLSVQHASGWLSKEIEGSDLLDKYGHERLSLQSGIPVYTYRRVGMMALPLMKNTWDLAIHPDISNTDQMVGVRVILVRFLAQALSDSGVLSYWGTQKDETLIILKQQNSFGEALFVDPTRRLIFSNGGEMNLSSHLKLIRKDKVGSGKLSREELISFLSVSTCLLSFQGITLSMKRSIYDVSGVISASYATSEAVVNL
jgi:hypothetical protein